MIVVTGASRGLGKVIAQRLIERKLEVFGLARNISEITFPALSCDVSSYENVKQVVRYFKKNQIDVTALVNSAGIASMNLALTTPRQVIEKIVNTNLLGTIYTSQLFSPFLIRKRKGSIINFSTIAVALGLKGESIYAASKAGVEGFTRSFAREMADFNITVNCIAPGPIKTDLIKGVSDEQINKIISQQIVPKLFKAEDVANLVELLIDTRSNSISGQVLHVGGV